MMFNNSPHSTPAPLGSCPSWLLPLMLILCVGSPVAFAISPQPTQKPKTEIHPKKTRPSQPTSPYPIQPTSLLDLDEEDEDEEEGDFAETPFAQAPASSKRSGSSSQKNHPILGGQPNSTSPVSRDEKGGISVGGTSANGTLRNTPTAESLETAVVKSNDWVTDFNFPDADVIDVAKALGKLTGKNFIFEKDIKGKITIISNSPVTVAQAWKAFLTALDANGFAMIQSGKYLRIARQRDAREKQLRTYTGESSPNTDALITRVFRLKYISAEEVVRAFRNFIPTTARLIAYEQTSTVIVTDTGSNIRKLASMLEILDVEGYDAGIEVVPVKYASAVDIARLVETLLPGTTTGNNSSPGKAGGSKFSARRTKEGGIINTVIADDRTNSLIVHANSKGTDQVKMLVAKLDQNKPATNASGKVHVYYLQFAEAEQVANTLNNFASQAGAKSGGGNAAGGTGSNPMSNNLFQEAVKISADKATNALVITASASDYFTVKRVIQSIDIPRDQVYVEAVIMDVELSKDTNTSANAGIIPKGGTTPIGSLPGASDFISMVTNPGGLSGGLFAYPLGQGSVTLNTGSGSVQVPRGMAMLQALKTYTHSNLLATPQIIALDNSESKFEQTEKIPIPVVSAVQGVGNSTSYSSQSVTLSLTIKPQINKLTQFVKLDVDAKLSTISDTNVPAAAKNSAIGTIERVAKTTVMAADGDTVVLGGLIRDSITKTEAKVPLLGDIPLLGWFFKKYSNSIQKSNLLIFLTPRIARQYEKVRNLLKTKLKDRDQFIQEYFGEDYLQEERNKLDASLPDIENFQNQLNPAKSLDDLSPETEAKAKEIAPPETLVNLKQEPLLPKAEQKPEEMKTPASLENKTEETRMPASVSTNFQNLQNEKNPVKGANHTLSLKDPLSPLENPLGEPE